jgi:hypothetical protein
LPTPIPRFTTPAISGLYRLRRNSPITHASPFPNGMYCNFALTNSRMGEQRESCQVTTNIHAAQESCIFFINSESATLVSSPNSSFRAQTYRHGDGRNSSTAFCNDTAVSLRVLISKQHPLFRLRHARPLSY